MKRLAAGALMALLLQAACAGDGARNVPADTEQVDTAADAPATTRSSGCGIDDSSALSGEGIGALRIGARVGDVRAECAVVSDTTVRGVEGMMERRILADLGRDTVAAEIVDDRVWRVHVEGRAFRTEGGLGVGTTVAALRRAGAARVLAGEGSMFITVPGLCGLSFRLGGVQFGQERPIADLPPDARVVGVLAFGCDSPAR